MKIDLNVDLGEGYASDGALMRVASSVNICCGEHAGDWDLTLRTIEIARTLGLRVGAHPGFPDRESMGRAKIADSDVDSYCASVAAQVARFADTGAMLYIKPHGELYRLCCDPELSGDVIDQVRGVVLGAAREYRVPLMLMPGAMADLARAAGVNVIREGFADRRYLPNGQLAPRWESGAVFHDMEKVREQACKLAGEIDSICLHGDTPGAVQFAETVRTALQGAGYQVVSCP